MKLFKKYYNGIYFIITENFKFFTDNGDWFISIYAFGYVLRLSSAGNYFMKFKK